VEYTKESIIAAITDPQSLVLGLHPNLPPIIANLDILLPNHCQDSRNNSTITFIVTAPGYFSGFFTTMGNALLAQKTIGSCSPS
jgi:hypothetical protein